MMGKSQLVLSNHSIRKEFLTATQFPFKDSEINGKAQSSDNKHKKTRSDQLLNLLGKNQLRSSNSVEKKLNISPGKTLKVSQKKFLIDDDQLSSNSKSSSCLSVKNKQCFQRMFHKYKLKEADSLNSYLNSSINNNNHKHYNEEERTLPSSIEKGNQDSIRKRLGSPKSSFKLQKIERNNTDYYPNTFTKQSLKTESQPKDSSYFTKPIIKQSHHRRIKSEQIQQVTNIIQFSKPVQEQVSVLKQEINNFLEQQKKQEKNKFSQRLINDSISLESFLQGIAPPNSQLVEEESFSFLKVAEEYQGQTNRSIVPIPVNLSPIQSHRKNAISESKRLDQVSQKVCHVTEKIGQLTFVKRQESSFKDARKQNIFHYATPRGQYFQLFSKNHDGTVQRQTIFWNELIAK